MEMDVLGFRIWMSALQFMWDCRICTIRCIYRRSVTILPFKRRLHNQLLADLEFYLGRSKTIGNILFAKEIYKIPNCLNTLVV